MRFALTLLTLALLLAGPAWAQDSEATVIELDLDGLALEGELDLDQLLGSELEIDLGEADVLGVRSLGSLLGDARAVTTIPVESFGAAPSLGAILERVPGLDMRSEGGLGQLSSVQLRGARAAQVLVLLDSAPLMLGPSDLSAIALPAIERIEVVRGPAAARFGAGALGGVVNIVTYQPPDQAQPSPEAMPSRDSCQCPADWDYQLALGAGSYGALTGSLSASQPGITWGISQLAAQNDFSYQRAGGSQGQRFNNAVVQSAVWAAWDADAWQHRVGVDHIIRGVAGSSEFPTRLASLRRNSLWWQSSIASQRFDLSAQQLHFDDPEPYLNRGAIKSDDTQVHAAYSYGSLADQRGVFGYKLSIDGVDSNSYGRQTRGGLDTHWHGEQHHGAYLYQLDLGTVANSDTGLDPVAHLGISTNINAGTSAYAAVGYAVRQPGFDELYYPDTGGVRGNPELSPERVVNYELGLTATLPAARFEVAVFHSDYQDSILWAPVSAYLVEARNTGQANITGLEALADIKVTDELWWRTAYTWLPVAEYASGVPLTGRSEQHANSRLEYIGRSASGALSLDYTGDIPADLFGHLVIRPRTLVGAELTVPFGQGDLGVSISNVFDESTRDSWNYPLPGREVFVTFRSEL